MRDAPLQAGRRRIVWSSMPPPAGDYMTGKEPTQSA